MTKRTSVFCGLGKKFWARLRERKWWMDRGHVQCCGWFGAICFS